MTRITETDPRYITPPLRYSIPDLTAIEQRTAFFPDRIRESIPAEIRSPSIGRGRPDIRVPSSTTVRRNLLPEFNAVVNQRQAWAPGSCKTDLIGSVHHRRPPRDPDTQPLVGF